MRTRNSYRAGFGLGQIMATLLVVLPTLAFSITFLIEYWKVMQVDNRLKLIASLSADFADQRSELRAFTDQESADFITHASKLCPHGRTIPIADLRAATDNATKGVIDITVKYTTPADATYFKNKVISTNIQTYSYQDQNMSVVLTCPTN